MGCELMSVKQAWVARNERVAVNIGATVHRVTQPAAAVTITDLSFEGCQLLCKDALDAGELIRVHLTGQGFFEAEVRWTLGEKAGARFLADCTC